MGKKFKFNKEVYKDKWYRKGDTIVLEADEVNKPVDAFWRSLFNDSCIELFKKVAPIKKGKANDN